MKREIPESVLLDQTPLGLGIYAEPNIELTNVVERLAAFYAFHLDPDGSVLEPMARIVNPEHEGIRIHEDDVWLLPYYRGYRILVIRHTKYISGPHACRLYYQSHQTGALYWLATLQIDDAMFYNEPRVMEQLNAAIARKEFFIAEHSRKDKVAK